jgi:hypothetical protein
LIVSIALTIFLGGPPPDELQLVEAEELVRKIFDSDRELKDELPGVVVCGFFIGLWQKHWGWDYEHFQCLEKNLSRCREAILAEALIDVESGNWSKQVVWIRKHGEQCDVMRVWEGRSLVLQRCNLKYQTWLDGNPTLIDCEGSSPRVLLESPH